MTEKRFSPSCDNNREPILAVLKEALSGHTRLLEIGSGTGQHAAYFAPALPHILWQTSDLAHNHSSIDAWLAELTIGNVRSPLHFHIGVDEWPCNDVDSVYTANTTHIMQPHEAQIMMQLVAQNLSSGGIFCQYGPFTVNGEFTSASNQSFNQHLLNEGCGGIRDIAELQKWASGLVLAEQHSMPANNMMLIWRKP
ncbi:MAG: DUF938 domain-containing protein [Paraglaciecola polaris]|uniref:DUF938 domain-containing protein n=1 Tax=Paraglaciecola polaris TaxID=222814 RepID=UPI003001D169|tara:strand:- start:155 stop:742 length:588 start_codon:yes stop_codon:yes gene_type:complete